MEKSSLKKIECDPKSVSFNQLNNSSSKMQYSISKAKRWQWQGQSSKLNPEMPGKFYDLPNVKEKRSTSFGYGNKVPICETKIKTPGAGTYDYKSLFQRQKSKGITMGAGRQVVKSNSAFDIRDASKVPSPGQYQPKYLDYSKSFSMASRMPDLTDKWIKSVPGPGNYEIQSIISKFENSPSPKMSHQARKSQVQEKLRIANYPGPGQYSTIDVSSTAKFRKVSGNSFSHTPRRGIIDDRQSKIPGPGSYKMFSDFLY